MKIAISAESTIDMPKELLDKFDIHTLPFTILLNDEEYLDGVIPITEIFEFVDKHKILPKTSAVNEYQYEEHFKNLLQTYDAVVHVSTSSGISCACENAKKVSKKLNNVYVIDSQTLSTGIALLALKACKLRDEGKTAEEIYKEIKATVPSVQAGFVLSRLDYLRKGGRCSALQLLGSNLLKIKPEISLKDGKMYMKRKFRGTFEDVVTEYSEKLLSEHKDINMENVFITYTTAPSEILEKLESTLKQKGFKNIYRTTAGCTITSHCGQGCLGVLFLNN